MRKLIKSWPLLLTVLLAGCTGTLTNLTPNYQTRNASGLYPVAVAFHTRQQSLRWESIKPAVVVGDEVYPMRLMPYMTNRWETLVPVPAGTSELHYRYKLDWQYNAIPVPQNDSMLSAPQTLQIVGQ
jgi:hypothetical protein